MTERQLLTAAFVALAWALLLLALWAVFL